MPRHICPLPAVPTPTLLAEAAMLKLLKLSMSLQLTQPGKIQRPAHLYFSY